MNRMKTTLILFWGMFALSAFAQVTIQGKVIMDDGKSPENVKVVFKQTAPAVLYDSIYTDANGDFSKELIKGIYDVTFSKIGYESQTITAQSFYVNKTISSITLKHYDLSGSINGILNAGIYMATDILIPANDSLELKPGVTIKFFGNCGLIANGKLKAIGTHQQPITFTALDTQKKHKGITVKNQSNVFKNVIFEYSAGSGLDMQGCNNILMDSVIARFNAHGLTASNSSEIVVTNSKIISNAAGDGISFGNCTSKVIQSVIISNKNGVHNGKTSVFNSLIANNSNDGGFVDFMGDTIRLYNSIIINNSAYNLRQNWQGGGSKCFHAENCVFFGKSQPALNFYGLDAYLGQVIAQNNNAISSDVYSNLYQDPKLVDYINGDYNLQATSPCIDAGYNIIDTLMLMDINKKCRFAKGISTNNYGYIDIGLTEYNSAIKNRQFISLGGDSLLCRSTSITLNPGSGFQNYYWSTQSTNNSISANKTGTYSVFAENNTSFGFASKNILASTALFTADSRFKQSALAGTDYSRSANTVQFADIDNDNDLDMIYLSDKNTFSGKKINLLKNNNGKFNLSESLICPYGYNSDGSGTPWEFSYIIAKDFNFDNKIEIVATISGGINEDSTWVFTYKNNKLFNITERYPQKFLNLVDYNNDGLYDTNTSKAYAGSSLSANRGNGVFDNSYVYTTGRSPWVDFNSDGFKDAFSGNVLKANNKDFTFTDLNINELSANSLIQNIGDFNNDGKFDLIERQYDSPTNIRIFKNNDNFSFINSGVSFPSGQLSQFTPIDYNNDGLLDFIDGNDGAIYENGNNFAFTKKASNTGIVYQQPVGSSWQYRLRTADFNNDNALDLYYNGTIYLNNDCKKNTKPSQPSNISVTQTNNSTLIFKWNRGSDNETPQRGLSYNYYIGTAPGKDDIVSSNSNLNTGYRRIVEYGNASLDTFAVFVRKLLPATYYVGVQTIDNSFVGSAFTTSSFTINNNGLTTKTELQLANTLTYKFEKGHIIFSNDVDFKFYNMQGQQFVSAFGNSFALPIKTGLFRATDKNGNYLTGKLMQ